LRFDVDARPSDNTQLLAALRAFDVAEQVVGPLRPSLEDIASSLGAAVREAGLASSRIKMFFAGRTRRAQALSALRSLHDSIHSPRIDELAIHMDHAVAAIRSYRKIPASDLWQEYESKAASYNGLLIDVGD